MKDLVMAEAKKKTEKKATGFTAAPASKGPRVPRLAGYTSATAPKDLRALIAKAHFIVSKHEAHKSVLARLNTITEKHGVDVRAEVGKFTGLDRHQKRTIAHTRIVEHRNLVRSTSSNERYAILKDMDAIQQDMAGVQALYRNPHVMLMRHGIGSPERSQYDSSFRNSGPAELDMMAATAATTGNKVMGAAVLSAMDGLNRGDRAQLVTTKEELSEHLIGADHAKAQEALRITKNRFQTALSENQAFEQGRVNPTHKIGMAIRTNAETGVLDDEGDE